MVLAGAVVIVLVAVAAARPWRALEGEPAIERTGSVVVAGGEPVEIVRTPTSWRVQYRIEDLLDDEVRTSTGDVAVRRPFESRSELGGRVEVARFGRLATAAGGAQPLVLAEPPGVAR